MMNKNDLITVRDGVGDDFNFIMATFLRGLYYGDSAFSAMQKDSFMKQYNRILVRLLGSSKIKVKVACLKEDSNVVLAYSILNEDETTLHWVFTKKSWRNIGLGKSLIPITITNCTHMTSLGAEIKQKKNLPIEFDPFKLVF